VPSDAEQIKNPEDFCRSELDSCCFEETSKEISSLHAFEKADVVSFIGSSRTNTGIIFISGIIANSDADLTIMMNTLKGLKHFYFCNHMHI
jgi:hypothetical protein